ncbi:MAG: phospholipase [Gammaproteobacteria bacterium]|nr:MAG: phospholipase [Gammaproteobacteria bacterium]
MKILVVVMVVVCSQYLFAQGAEDCTSVINPEQRLVCYDRLHGYGYTAPISAKANNQKGDLVEEKAKKSIRPYRLSYFLPVSYNSDRQTADQIIGIETPPDLDEIEGKFQISFKFTIWDEFFADDVELLGAYTQKSFWQMYNSTHSAPFRETNYEPEIFVSKEMDIDVLGLNWFSTNFGFVHQSNGRANPLSRSWNRIYFDLMFKKGNFGLSLKPWWRVEENVAGDDNPDIEDYLGTYEITMNYQLGESEFSLMLRNLASSEHQETFKLSWLYPLTDSISLYAEYFHGYGESLVDYNYLNETIGIGLSINDLVD